MRISLLLLAGLLFFTGCAAVAPLESSLIAPDSASSPDKVQTMTVVRLNQENFRLLKINVVGESWGFKLLGLFTIVPATKVRAFTRMYHAAHVPKGIAAAPVHLLVEESETGFLLFSIPQTYVRADFVVFDNPQAEECDEDKTHAIVSTKP